MKCMTGFIGAERNFTMNKRWVVLCVLSVMLTACGTEDAQSAVAVISSESVTGSETENVTESEAPTVPETTAAAVCTTLPVAETETVSEEKAFDNYRDAYKAKLAEIAEDEYSSVPAFDLLDMDGDGIPELFASYADHHAAGAFIFTYKDGELLPVVCTETPSGEQRFFGSYGQVCASSDGYVKCSYFGMGVGLDSFFEFDGKTLTLIASTEHGSGYIYDEDGSPVPDEYYMINGGDVSAEEYNAVFGENYAHDWKELGRGHFIDEAADNVIYGE